MDKVAWQVTVHGVAKNWTQLSNLSTHTNGHQCSCAPLLPHFPPVNHGLCCFLSLSLKSGERQTCRQPLVKRAWESYLQSSQNAAWGVTIQARRGPAAGTVATIEGRIEVSSLQTSRESTAPRTGTHGCWWMPVGDGKAEHQAPQNQAWLCFLLFLF